MLKKFYTQDFYSTEDDYSVDYSSGILCVKLATDEIFGDTSPRR